MTTEYINENDFASSSSETEEISSSQASSFLPSPVVTTLGEKITLSQASSSPSPCSQTSSFLPSPMVTTLNKLVRNVECSCGNGIDALCSKLEKLSSVDRNHVLGLLISKCEKDDLKQLKESEINHLSKVFGEYCREKIKSEADTFRFKRSREDSDSSSVEILSNKLKIEQIHIFFESATGKTGRSKHNKQEKVANYQATFYECLLKAANLNTLGPYCLNKANKMKLQVQSKVIFENQIGGSFTFHQTNNPTVPLPMTFKGPLISDNAQRGSGKFQHFNFGKLDRSTPIFVSTHNIRAESVSDFNDNEIFEDERVAPYNNQFHPIFRPVSPEFLKVVEERLQRDENNGLLAANTVLEKWLDEIIEDKKAGKGITSHEKICQKLNFGSSQRVIICQKCHFELEYDKNSQNVCPRCQNNPTFYTDDLGPYRKYKFPEKGPNTVVIKEQEPIALNPSGRQNLIKLHDQLKDFWPPECKSYPFYGDGLPGVSFERIKSDSVQCVTHGVNIQLKDINLLVTHCSEECVLDWPLKGLYVLFGESHEEIAMIVIALTNSIPFGILDMLSELGRHNKNSQLQAIRTKRLHTLYELNYIYSKAAFTATAIPFLNYCEKSQVEPTVDKLYQFIEKSTNFQYQARFRALLSLNIPCILKSNTIK